MPFLQPKIKTAGAGTQSIYFKNEDENLPRTWRLKSVNARNETSGTGKLVGFHIGKHGVSTGAVAFCELIQHYKGTNVNWCGDKLMDPFYELWVTFYNCNASDALKAAIEYEVIE